MSRTPTRQVRWAANSVGLVAFVLAAFPVYWMVNSSFLDRNQIRNPVPTWVPFGGGAHMCIGLHFATMQIRLLMAHVLRHYRIELDEGAGRDWAIFPIPRPKDGLPVRMVPIG